MTPRGDVAGSGSQAKNRHIAVEALVLARLHQKALVPDADRTILVANARVEALPGGEVLIVGTAGEALQILEGAPVLDEHGLTPAEIAPRTEQALLGMDQKLPQHRAHRQERRH